MGEERIGSILITRGGKLEGIFTERDLLTTFLSKEDAFKTLETSVGKQSSSPLITVPSGTSVHKAAAIMALKHIKRLPVAGKDRLVGIITARDLVEAYAE